MPTIGEFINERLSQAGPSGLSQADLFQELRGRTDVPKRRGGTYHSFSRYFWQLVQLGLVEFTGATEPAFQRGVQTSGVLSDRRLYRLTSTGAAGGPEWAYIPGVLYPDTKSREAQREYYRRTYVPSGRPRGRPRRRLRRAPTPPAPPVVLPVPRRARPEPLPPVELPPPPPEAVSAPPGAIPKRRIVPFSVTLATRLDELVPRIGELSALWGAEARGLLDKISTSLQAISDSANTAREQARRQGDETEAMRLDAIYEATERAGDAIGDIEQVLETGDMRRYRDALGKLAAAVIERVPTGVAMARRRVPPAPTKKTLGELQREWDALKETISGWERPNSGRAEALLDVFVEGSGREASELGLEDVRRALSEYKDAEGREERTNAWGAFLFALEGVRLAEREK